MKRKFLSVLLAACMLGTLLTGCGRRGEGTEEAAASAGDEPRQEVVTLKWYMSLPSVAADTAQIIEKLNEYTRDKIGVEIDYRPMSDSDYMEKMPTYINSGEDFDICFTSF